MNLLEDESVVMELPEKDLVLTTHRVRYHVKGSALQQLQSIMLEQVASCSMQCLSYPIFIVFAVLSLLFGAIIANTKGGGDPVPIAIGVVAGLIFLSLYYGTRAQIISLASPGTTIRVRTTEMKPDAMLNFIDAVEEAKNNRYSL